MTPERQAVEARRERRVEKERAEDEARQRQEDNRHGEDAVMEMEEDEEDARRDADDAAADRGDP